MVSKTGDGEEVKELLDSIAKAIGIVYASYLLKELGLEMDFEYMFELQKDKNEFTCMMLQQYADMEMDGINKGESHMLFLKEREAMKK